VSVLIVRGALRGTRSGPDPTTIQIIDDRRNPESAGRLTRTNQTYDPVGRFRDAGDGGEQPAGEPWRETVPPAGLGPLLAEVVPG
jgi:hypothetical protein